MLERVRTLDVRWNSKLLPQITISLGLALYPGHEASTETLLPAADLALYDAKRAGRDRLVVSGEAKTSTRPT